MYVRADPTRCFNRLGEDINNPFNGSSCREFGMHFKNWYPPPSFRRGNVSCKMSRNSFAGISNLGKSISFSPNPAANNSSLSHSFSGVRFCPFHDKHTNLCFQAHLFFSFFLDVPRNVASNSSLIDFLLGSCKLSLTSLTVLKA